MGTIFLVIYIGDKKITLNEDLGLLTKVQKQETGLEVILGKLGAMKKGTQTSDKKNHLLEMKNKDLGLLKKYRKKKD